jgi:hypothetical protein
MYAAVEGIASVEKKTAVKERDEVQEIEKGVELRGAGNYKFKI